MVEALQSAPSSGSHSGSNPNNHIDQLMSELRGDGNSFTGNSDMR